MLKQFDHVYKTVIIGNSGVGKSSILVRFSENKFNQHYLATIGVDFRFKTISINGEKVKFQIWDTAGQQRFRTITSAYYRGSNSILIVFDITDPQSFADVSNFWINQVEMYGEKDAILVLIGNKSDLTENRKVQMNEIESLCKEKKLIYVECSAKQNDNVTKIFMEIGKKLMVKQNIKSITHKQDTKVLQQKTQKQPKKGCC